MLKILVIIIWKIKDDTYGINESPIRRVNLLKIKI